MILALDSGTIGAFSGFIVAALAIGTVIGRGLRNFLQERAQKKHEEAQIKQAVVGRPPDPTIGDKGAPGLVQQMAESTKQIEQNSSVIAETNKLLQVTIEKLDNHIKSHPVME